MIVCVNAQKEVVIPNGAKVGTTITGVVTLSDSEFKNLDGTTSNIQEQLTGKADLANADTIDIYSRAQVDSINTEKSKTTNILKALGSTIKTASKLTKVTDYVAVSITDGVLMLIEMEQSLTQYTFSSIRMSVRGTGSYTADNNNRAGVYKRVGSTFTLVASVANSATLWTATASTLQTITWDVPYVVPANERIYVGFLINYTTGTAPTFTGIQNNGIGYDPSLLGTTEAFSLQKIAGNTDLPASFDVSVTNRSQGVVSIYGF